ncbi:MAG TPA: type II and III secretion system protein [Planctomycetaceae bacterium]|nr:type II and III secretion system protein [Planctomycetaceae bacterium]
MIVESSPTDKRRTRDQLIIKDLPEYIERAADSLAQTDLPPRQVLIEAYVLQINLKDDLRHGVDIQAILARIDNTRVSMKTVGFANPNASPAFFFGIDGTDLDVLVEAIKLTTDAKTLASPKVLVVNGQEARIQVGSQLGYFVTTTTQTSTMQQVDFLELGVVLKVTPQITDSGEILMHVKPEISSGQINPATGLPEEDTTQVETTVILPDGNGMIIGGLIKEGDTESQTKIPLVGDLWVVGRFFQRRTVHRERNEILIALVPRVVTYDSGHPVACKPDPGDEAEWTRTTTPLVGPQLQRVDRRPLEPELPDAIRNPRKLDLSRVSQMWKKPTKAYPPPADFYFRSSDERTQGNTPRPLIYDSQVLSGPELSLQPMSEIPPMPAAVTPPPPYEVPVLPPHQGIAP